MSSPVPAAVEEERERVSARTPIIHPATGEVLPDEIAVLAEHERRVDRYLRRLGTHYEFRRRLRERIADLRGPAALPARRHQTPKQQAVDECPRCGNGLKVQR